MPMQGGEAMTAAEMQRELFRHQDPQYRDFQLRLLRTLKRSGKEEERL